MVTLWGLRSSYHGEKLVGCRKHNLQALVLHARHLPRLRGGHLLEGCAQQVNCRAYTCVPVLQHIQYCTGTLVHRQNKPQEPVHRIRATFLEGMRSKLTAKTFERTPHHRSHTCARVRPQGVEDRLVLHQLEHILQHIQYCTGVPCTMWYVCTPYLCRYVPPGC